jgi:hypothetical protein
MQSSSTNEQPAPNPKDIAPAFEKSTLYHPESSRRAKVIGDKVFAASEAST